jgi:hypothetical protein
MRGHKAQPKHSDDRCNLFVEGQVQLKRLGSETYYTGMGGW